MNILPVIARELRTEARHGFTYWLRVLGAGALMLVVAFAGSDYRVTYSRGAQLFAILHGILFGLIWLFVPLITADCISREKRQGTLGLLLLTPLKPGDIVLAKSLVHGLRSLSLCLAVIPVLIIPFLMGGVPWTDVVFSILMLGSAVCWALAAGLLASASSRRWLRALVFAAVLAGVFLIIFIHLNGFLVNSMLGPSSMFPSSYRRSIWETGLLGGAPLLPGPAFANFLAVKPTLSLSLLKGAAFLLFSSFIVLLIVIDVAAAKIRRTWRDEPASAFTLFFQKLFTEPMFLVSLYRRLMRRKIEKNPIGWLEQRTWTGRLVTWSWFGVLISVYGFIIADDRFFGQGFVFMQFFLAEGLVISMAVTAAGSFQRERESGVLELLLVSPVKTGQIVGGRLRGIWGQFLLVLMLWIWVWIYCAKTTMWRHWDLDKVPITIAFFLCSFVTVPVIGLYCSLRCRHFMSSLICTLVVGLFLPTYLAGLGVQLLRLIQGVLVLPQIFIAPLRINLLAVVIQILIAGWLAVSLYRNLAHRKFAALERRE